MHYPVVYHKSTEPGLRAPKRASSTEQALLRCPTATTADFIIFAVAGWINRRQQEAIAYLREENRVLREQLGSGQLRLTDDQRRRLALRSKELGRQLLAETASPAVVRSSKGWVRSASLRDLWSPSVH